MPLTSKKAKRSVVDWSSQLFFCLGITNDSHIIAYDNDEDFGVFSSPRVWWTFRCFGHDAISVLNGGFHRWLAAGLPVESGEPKPIESKHIKKIPEAETKLRHFISRLSCVHPSWKWLYYSNKVFRQFYMG